MNAKKKRDKKGVGDEGVKKRQLFISEQIHRLSDEKAKFFSLKWKWQIYFDNKFVCKRSELAQRENQIANNFLFCHSEGASLCVLYVAANKIGLCINDVDRLVGFFVPKIKLWKLLIFWGVFWKILNNSFF